MNQDTSTHSLIVLVNEVKQVVKEKNVLRKIKKEIRNETMVIAKREGIKRNTSRYMLIEQDVINGKPQILGALYKVPQESISQSLNN